ncbi:hypothetical protein [Robbsia andropogonis]|uniref:hypothetical protein n=1 Tax=Robbsia andropogonis TaxID=28092 RepID=UPI00138E2561
MSGSRGCQSLSPSDMASNVCWISAGRVVQMMRSAATSDATSAAVPGIALTNLES